MCFIDISLRSERRMGAGWKFSPDILLLFCQCARTCLSCRRAAARARSDSNAFASLQISIFFDRCRFGCQMISRRLRAHKHFTAGYKAAPEHISLAFKETRSAARKGDGVTAYGEDALEYLIMMIDGSLVTLSLRLISTHPLTECGQTCSQEHSIK
jgi:hypothetical protein